MRFLAHIMDRHGAQGKADHSMENEEDLARIKYVVNNYDLIGFAGNDYRIQNSDKTKAKTIIMQKKINDDYYYVVEIIPDSKKKKMYVKTAYINKIDEFLQGNDTKSRSDVQDGLAQNSSSNLNVNQDKENVNIKLDSTGRELTPGQQAYFKDSKVRNSEGNLLVVYHGTPYGGFNVFKNDLNYFTSNEKYADIYQEPSASSVRGYYEPATNKMTYKGYLNIVKPFDIRDKETKKIFIEEYIRGGWAQGIDP